MKPNCINPEWIGRAKCTVCDVRNIVLFAGLPDHDLANLLLPIDTCMLSSMQLCMNRAILPTTCTRYAVV